MIVEFKQQNTEANITCVRSSKKKTKFSVYA